MVSGQIGAAPEIRCDAGGEIRHIHRFGRQGHDDLAIAVRNHIGIVEMALALWRAALAES